MKGFWLWLLGPLAMAWLVSLFLYPRLPEPLPVHWNAQGEPDRYGSRLEALFLFPLVLTLLIPLFGLLPRIDPKRPKGVEPVLVGAAWFLALLHLGFLGVYLGLYQDPLLPIQRLLGLFSLLFAWWLPRLPPNWFAGVRTPWTLEDPGVWRKTHRAGGWFFLIAGVLLLLLTPNLWFLMGLLGGGALFLVVYSYWLWRKKVS